MNAEPSPLDRAFARLMLELNGSPAPGLEAAALAVSAARVEGHACVDVSPLVDVARLRATRVVGAPGEWCPLILDARGRLYLQRYWQYENALALAIRARLAMPAPAVDERALKDGLARFFPANSKREDDQRRAVDAAVRRNFTVLTGGPGTGKTRTLAVILALLHEQFHAAGREPRIALAAPTGKAAARVMESIHRAIETLPGGESLRDVLPHEAKTLHRLLGVVPESPYFRHDAERPLAADVVVVDEASMVDLALMAKLFAAIPPDARVILSGDRDQLSSVEAGAVLADVCAGAPEAVAELRENFRFGPDSGIHRLSQLVNAGDADAAVAILNDGGSADVAPRALPQGGEFSARVGEAVVGTARGWIEAADPRAALDALARFRILCATRRGAHGVERLNEIAAFALADAGLVDPSSAFYHGRPVMVTRNDYALRLFNGDTGVILREPSSGALRAFFPDGSGTPRAISPARLPAHETAFALTVHKSQGSEFERVLLILPGAESAVLTRELLYTGLTRARRGVELWWTEAALRTGILRATERTGGLRDALACG